MAQTELMGLWGRRKTRMHIPENLTRSELSDMSSPSQVNVVRCVRHASVIIPSLLIRVRPKCNSSIKPRVACAATNATNTQSPICTTLQFQFISVMKVSYRNLSHCTWMRDEGISGTQFELLSIITNHSIITNQLHTPQFRYLYRETTFYI